MHERNQDIERAIDESGPLISLALRDIRRMVQTMQPHEIRFLVDTYYQVQDYRKAAGNQRLSLEKSGESHILIDYVLDQMLDIESTIKRAMDAWTDVESSGMGAWAKGICGIGPVLSAGLLAHIDITKAPTVGHIWSFAGLDPRTVWSKGEKRPWNAQLKVVCWKIGESFVKVSGNKNDIYGKLYLQRKEYERQRNDAGELKSEAERMLSNKKFRKDTVAAKAYAEGRLPDGHIHARAKRWTVKLFLAHWWQTAREQAGLPVVLPYPVAHMGHAHVMPPLAISGENHHVTRASQTR